MIRVNAARLVAGLAFFLAVGPARAGKEDAGFLTNIGLMDELTRQAVEALLDSLAFPVGDTVSIVQSGGGEGDAFVAEAIARSLARRGCVAHLTEMPAAVPVQEAPQQPVSPPPVKEEPELPRFGGLFPDSISQGRADSIAQGLIDTTRSSFDQGFAQGAVGTAEDQTKVDQPPPAGQPPAGTGEAAPSPPTGAGASGAPEAGVTRPVPVRRIYPAGSVLEFRLLEFGVTYPSVKRRLFVFGKGSVHRLAGVYVQASRIEGPGGRVIDVASGQAHWHDQLGSGSRALAEGAAYPFLKPTTPPSSLARIVEPIAVLGIVSSLVYLFYQNQN